MKYCIQPAAAALLLIVTISISPVLRAQTTGPTSPESLIVPSITVESGKQAVIQINGSQYTVTPTIRAGDRVELRTSVTSFPETASLVSPEVVEATDVKVLIDRIERTVLLRAFEKVVTEICRSEFEFSEEPVLGDEASEHAKRVELQTAKRNRLQEIRERLRREMLEEFGPKSARK